MNTSFTEFVIGQNGKMFRRDVQTMDVVVPESVITPLTENVTRKCLYVAAVTKEQLLANVCITGRGEFWSVPLKQLPLRAPFHLIDGVMVPAFGSNTDPVMDMKWTPPNGMDIIAGFDCEASGSGTASALVACTQMYLFAHAARRYYKLPLGNLYDDCRVCTGRRDSVWSGCYAHLLETMLDMFSKSMWNADLWGNAAECQKLIRFKPHNKGFDQQAPLEAWTNLCKVVSTPITPFVTPHEHKF